MTYPEFKENFSHIVTELITQKVATTEQLSDDSFIRQFISYIPKLAAADGKRSRPYVAYLMYKTAGGVRDEEAINIFAALELIHLFALIHDDVMDRGEIRRGIPAVSPFIKDLLKKRSIENDADHLAESQAILLGDLCFAWAGEVMSSKSRKFGKDGELAQDLFNEMISGLIVGQMIDVDCTVREQISKELIGEKIKLKTAGYTFVYPMKIGAALAGKLDLCNEFCQQFGGALGAAFQIQDDLLDIISTDAALGKKVLADIQDGQHTYFTQYIFEQGSDADKKELREFMGKSLAPEKYDQVRNLFERSGAIEYGKNLIAELFASAREILAHEFTVEERKPWEELVGFIEKRRT